jgi:hypothetical protein
MSAPISIPKYRIDLSIKQDRWWDLYNFTIVVDEENIGLIRISVINIGRAQEAMPTAWDYMNATQGWSLRTQDLTHTWLHAHLHAGRAPQSIDKAPWAIFESDYPCGDAMRADLVHLDRAKGYSKARDAFMRSRRDFAMVDWINIEDGSRNRSGINWRRMGLGSMLYRHAAKYMATLGYPIFSSTIISDAAKTCWKKMFDSRRYPIAKSRKLCNKGQFRYKMDFR